MLLVEMSKKRQNHYQIQQAQLKATLHQSKYVLLKEEPTPEQQLKLEALRKVAPLGRMHSLKKNLEIFENSKVGLMAL